VRHERKSAAAPLTIAIAVLLLPVLYFLSIGPAIALIERGYIDYESRALWAYTWPIREGCQRSSTFKNAVKRYALLWAPPQSAYKYSPD
jgi:hypothetical protein